MKVEFDDSIQDGYLMLILNLIISSVFAFSNLFLLSPIIFCLIYYWTSNNSYYIIFDESELNVCYFLKFKNRRKVFNADLVNKITFDLSNKYFVRRHDFVSIVIQNKDSTTLFKVKIQNSNLIKNEINFLKKSAIWSSKIKVID